jgi:hypothetical protein
LVPGDSLVDFPAPTHGLAARDATGNLSEFIQPAATNVPAGGAHEGPPPPLLSGSATGGIVTLNWPAPASESHWELFYAAGTWAGPFHEESGADEGASPIDINELDFTGSYTLNGLTRGQWYSFAVRAYGRMSQLPPSLLSNWVWLLVTDGVDSNSDGCPDDWHEAQGLPEGAGDADGDALSNIDECIGGSNPRNPDSDGDGWIDGNETALESNPLDADSYPPVTPADAEGTVYLPTLLLATDKLAFYAYTQGPNPAPQSVGVSNLGQGTLVINVTSDQSWLGATVTGAGIQVNIDKTDLERGVYNGELTVSANGAASPQTIYVNLVMIATAPGQQFPQEPQQPPQGSTLYIPIVGR